MCEFNLRVYEPQILGLMPKTFYLIFIQPEHTFYGNVSSNCGTIV
jgi:hypothetical protein